MDEITAAGKRKWAWSQLDSYGHSDDEGRTLKANSFADRMEGADKLAAWVMSGHLPDPSATRE